MLETRLWIKLTYIAQDPEIQRSEMIGDLEHISINIAVHYHPTGEAKTKTPHDSFVIHCSVRE